MRTFARVHTYKGSCILFMFIIKLLNLSLCELLCTKSGKQNKYFAFCGKCRPTTYLAPAPPHILPEFQTPNFPRSSARTPLPLTLRADAMECPNYTAKEILYKFA